MNKPFKRTIEKVLVWIANIFLILISGALAIVSYSGMMNTLLNDSLARQAFIQSFTSEVGGSYTTAEIESMIDSIPTYLTVYTNIVIVITLIAIVFSFLMKFRILTGVVFLLLSIAVLVISIGSVFFIYIPYFVVALMLFIRKEKPQDNNFDNNQSNQNQEVEKIEYV